MAPGQVTFLLDVDNTLLDNERFVGDLGAQLQRSCGASESARYWEIFASLRLLQMSAFLLEYPFAERLYPQALETVAHLGKLGWTVVLSDGDVIFQPRKVQRSGIWDSVDGRVLIYMHKERQVAAIQSRFPASHYVMIDDKPQLLGAVKRALGDAVTTVCVRQGHYAIDRANTAIDPQPDLNIGRIGDLIYFSLSDFFRPPGRRARPQRNMRKYV